jgi:hypothetical protein
MAGQGGALGKGAAARDSVSPPQKASRSLADAVARARAERKFTCGDYTTALKLAKANGEKVGSLELDDERLTEAVDKFALVLTNKDYQMTLYMTTEVFYGMDADSKLKAMRNKITVECLNKLGVDRLRCAYVAVRAWLEKKNLLGECADGVPEYLLLEYLAGVKEEGQKIRAGGCDALEKSVLARDEPMALLGPGPRVGTLPQTGNVCGEYHRRGIQDLCKLFRFNWDGSTLKQNFRIQGKSDRVPQTTHPPSIRMVVMMERFDEDKGNSIVLRNLAAGYLLCCFGSVRIGNAQRCWIPHLLTEVEILADFVCQDKTQKRAKARPRPFWVPYLGATGSSAWLDVFRETLDGVSDKKFIFRAFDGDVLTSNTFLPGPLIEGGGLIEDLQATLRVACGLSMEESTAHTLHRPRHFMPEVSSSREEPVASRNQLGRWTGSAVQDDFLIPECQK